MLVACVCPKGGRCWQYVGQGYVGGACSNPSDASVTPPCAAPQRSPGPTQSPRGPDVGNEIEARFPFAIIVDVNPVVYKTSLRESTIRYQQQQQKNKSQNSEIFKDFRRHTWQGRGKQKVLSAFSVHHGGRGRGEVHV